MLYEDARPRIVSGDMFALRRKKGFITQLIRHVTGQSYSHIGVFYWDQSVNPARLMVFEARQSTGVVTRYASDLTPFDWVAISSTKAQWSSAALNFMRGKCGQRYSIIDAALAGIGLGPFFGGNICSEVGAQVASLLYARPCPARTPGDLVSWLEDQGASITELI